MDELDVRLDALAGQLRVDEPVPRVDLDRRARRVRRRRWTSSGAIASLVAIVAVVSIVSVWNRNPGRHVRVVSPTTATTSPKARSSVSLPSKYLFDQISIADGRLVLTGEIADTAASTPRCASAIVDPQTLQVGTVREVSCDGFGVGQTIGIVNQYVRNSNNATIRVARIDAHTGHVSDGPVVMVYSVGSTSRPVSAIGGGWLWIYDVDTTKGPELLQVSASSGSVVNTVSMPAVYRPIMVANDDGLWLGPSIGGAGPAALYYVAPGSNAAEVVVPGLISSTATKSGTIAQSVCWLVGSGHDLWSGIGPTCDQQTIRRYNGNNRRPVFAVPDRGYDPNSVVGDKTHGLWTMQWVPPGGTTIPTAATRPQVIVRIDPDTGVESVAARVPPIPYPKYNSGLADGQAAYLDGALYVLEPPFRRGGYAGYTSLIRVALPSRPAPTSVVRASSCPGPPNTVPARYGQDVVVVYVPCGCPTQQVTPAPPGANPTASAVRAAKAWLEHAGWAAADIEVGAVYKVGDTTKGQFNAVFARNVPEYCGANVASASYGVELDNPTIPNTGRQESVVVAHFVHGWEVWGKYP